MGGRTTDRYETLDGLRGVAAMAVVVLHHRPAFGGNGVFGHAYLAVDFFFILSGFVLARAYADRLTLPGAVPAFLIDRAIRLWPLLLFGTILGMTARVWTGVGIGEAAAEGALNAFAWPAFGAGDPFVSNPPAWSLFWECFVNVGFALAMTGRLAVSRTLLLFSCGATMLVIDYARLGMDVGWNHATFLFGAPRTALGFTIGVMLARTAAPANTARTMRLWLAPALLAVFTLLPSGSAASVIYDPLAAMIVFPLLVSVAARTQPRFRRLARFSGDLSFPLYILHDPLLRWLTICIEHINAAPLTPGIERLLVLMTIPLSFAIFVGYDIPVRKFLRKLRHRIVAPGRVENAHEALDVAVEPQIPGGLVGGLRKVA